MVPPAGGFPGTPWLLVVYVVCVVFLQGNQGLGIMIIEGKHADLGQGIFVSDIQEGSAAEQVAPSERAPKALPYLHVTSRININDVDVCGIWLG